MANFIWMYCSGLTFSTYNPVFYNNTLDFTTNVLLLTNIQQLIVSAKDCRIILDIIFFLLPLILIYVHYFKIKLRPIFAIANTLYNIFYCALIPIFTCTSVQQYIPWMIIPLVFIYKSEEKFATIFYCLRWVFLAIFLSAGLWKIATGSIFYTEQFSAILIQQHAQALIDGKAKFYINTLIQHKYLAYFFYIAAFIAEVSFIIGFFTKKYDRYLAVFFCAFILLDYVLMEINYFSWIAFIGFLLLPTKHNVKDLQK